MITHPGIQPRIVKKLCRAPGLQQNIRRGRPEEAGGGIEEEGKRSRKGEAGSRRGEQGDEERKGRRERKGRCDEGIGCWRASGQGDGLCNACVTAGTGRYACHVGMQGKQSTRMENNDRRFYFSSGNPNTRPPKFPTDPAKVPAWRHRMMFFLNSLGLGYTVKQSTNPVNIISEDEIILARRHTPQVVADHERPRTFLLEATVDASFEETMLAAQTLEQAWHASHSGLGLAN